jgi:putative transcriptional regulator
LEEKTPITDYIVLTVAKRIAGDIAYSENPSLLLRKWREYFGVSQVELAKTMGVSASVISDYEKGRRTPGAKFIKRFVDALISIDASRGWVKVRNISRSLGIPPGVIIDMREFIRPLSVEEVANAVKGIILAPEFPMEKKVYGYTVIDSIKAIMSLSGIKFYTLLGTTTERVVVFTGVRLGRSPMVAVRVSPIKPSMVVIHGPRGNVDPLAIELAKIEGIPFILSLAKDVEELITSLRKFSEPLTISITTSP